MTYNGNYDINDNNDRDEDIYDSINSKYDSNDDDDNETTMMMLTLTMTVTVFPNKT